MPSLSSGIRAHVQLPLVFVRSIGALDFVLGTTKPTGGCCARRRSDLDRRISCVSIAAVSLGQPCGLRALPVMSGQLTRRQNSARVGMEAVERRRFVVVGEFSAGSDAPTRCSI